MKREWLARLALVLIVIGLPTTIFGYQYIEKNIHAEEHMINISASAPENGGFAPENIRVAKGETVTLRFTSTDVTHGIAIGPGWHMNLGNVDPGHVEALTVTFDEIGTYTYYCTTWCSPNHWRMRGTITVYDPENQNAVPIPWRDPVIMGLAEEGVNIDAVHLDTVHMKDETHTNAIEFVQQPSPERGEQLSDSITLPTYFEDLTWRQTHAPLEALEILEAENPSLEQADLIDVVVYLWLRDIATEKQTQAESYYNSNCAACHGQSGDGAGPMANILAAEPVAFSDLNYMFTMRSDVLYAKLRRGGMGTDMPNFGTLLTPEETWYVVEYLWMLAIQ